MTKIFKLFIIMSSIVLLVAEKLDCIVKVAKKSFEHEEIYYFNANTSILVKHLMNEASSSIITKIRDPLPTNFIFIPNNVMELKTTLQKLSTSKFWYPFKAKVLLILFSIEQASIYLKILKYFGIYNSLILYYTKTNRTRAAKWFPYHNGSCSLDFTHLVRFNPCRTSSEITPKQWFHLHIPEKLNNCVINILISWWPPMNINLYNNSVLSGNKYDDNYGIEGNLIGTIVGKMNASAIFEYYDSAVNFGEAYPNGNITGNLGRVSENYADIAIGGYMMRLERFQYFDASLTYYQDSVHWCVPHLPIFGKIIDSKTLLLSLLCFLLLTLLIWYVGKSRVNESKMYAKLSQCCMQTFGILIGQAVFSKPKRGETRLVVALLLFLSFCLISMYQTILVSILANSDLQQEMETLNDVYEKKFKIYGDLSYRSYYTDMGNSVNKYMFDNWNFCTNYTMCLKYVTKRKDSVICLEETYEKIVKNTEMHCFSERIVANSILMYMRKGFPLQARFNGIIARLVESGIVNKWLQKAILAERIAHDDVDNIDHNLNIDNLKPLFIGWLILCLFATVIFICEVFY